MQKSVKIRKFGKKCQKMPKIGRFVRLDRKKSCHKMAKNWPIFDQLVSHLSIARLGGEGARVFQSLIIGINFSQRDPIFYIENHFAQKNVVHILSM